MNQTTPKYCQCKYPLIRLDPFCKEYCGKCDRYFEEKRTMKPITPQELRIGDIIYFPFTNENVIVHGIAFKNNKTFIQARCGENEYFEEPELFKPIGLTEEILLRFGFENSVIRINEKWDDYYLKIDLKTDCIDNCVYGSRRNGMNFPYTIKYVHELQNLFYWLTGGKELELKPKQ